MQRRDLLLALGALGFWPAVSRGQQQTLRRIGYLGVSSFAAHSALGFLAALRRGLHQLGYDEGKNIEFMWRFAEGRYEKLQRLADEIVKADVDLILTHSTPGGLAAQAATTAISIVVIAAADLVATGLVSSLARPGGNVTGQNIFSAELGAKRLELMAEAVPAAKRVGVLLNRGNRYSELAFAGMEGTARSLGLLLWPVDLRSPQEFGPAFAALKHQDVHALVLLDDPVLIGNTKRIVELATVLNIPMIAGPEFDAKAGMLMAYGVDLRELWFRAATFVDKIFKGAKPSDLPVEQAGKFELTINLKRAKALGIQLSTELLARADEVIE